MAWTALKGRPARFTRSRSEARQYDTVTWPGSAMSAPYRQHCFPCSLRKIMFWGHSPAPNAVLWWLTLLLRIREVLCSNIGPETGNPDWGVLWFYLVPLGEFRDTSSTFNYATTSSFYSLSKFIIHVLSFRSTLCRPNLANKSVIKWSINK
jgi:hypothetical protein